MAKKTIAKKPLMQLQARAAAIRALEKNGNISAEIVVRAASHPGHPLHSCFEWDNAKAGHQYRLNQARALISQVRVVITRSNQRIVSPYYMRDPRVGPSQGYVTTAILRTDRDAAADALTSEVTRLQAQLERCREYATALDLEAELDASLASVLNLRSRIRRSRPSGTADEAHP